MRLVLPNKDAQIRNTAESIYRGCDMQNVKGWWSFEIVGDLTILNVGDGNGLTDNELKNALSEDAYLEFYKELTGEYPQNEGEGQ